jgi:hypothetical protein
LIEILGMAVGHEGTIRSGETWCCRVSMQTDQLQSEFPPTGVETLQAVWLKATCSD